MFLVCVIACAMLALVVWNALGWPGVGPVRPGADRSTVAVLVPARDEEDNLPECLDAVCSQGPVVAEVLVYDDESTDGTTAVARAAAARDHRVRLVPTQPRPAGWHGKPHACHQLGLAANAPWLLFLDADARLRPGAVERIVDAAEARGASLLSPWPGLAAVSPAERWLMPMLNYIVFTLFPAPLSLRSDLPSLGLAHGACILVDRAVYDAAGGHSPVRQELFEDTALARAWRALGNRGVCLDGQDTVSVRMYRSLGGLWRGFQKSFYPAFRTEVGFWAFLALHAATSVVPWVALGSSAAAGRLDAWAAGACGAVIAARAVQCARYRYPVWSALAHPAAVCAMVALGLTSWYRFRVGGGVDWKGRRYHA